MIMKKNFLYLFLILSVFACAKEVSVTTNQKGKLFFDSWMQTHEKEAYAQGAQGLGYYYDPTYEVEGTGVAVKDSSYVRVKYTARGLDGTILFSTEEIINRQMGTYDTTYYYGPVFWNKADITSVPAGVANAVADMKVGGRRRAFIPSWLMVHENHATPEAYINSSTTPGVSSVYELEIVEAVHNITYWELDSLIRYAERQVVYPYHASDASVPAEKARFVRCSSESSDTTGGGYYYQQLKKAVKDKKLPNDTTIYINYVGRLLNGKVFDTNIKDSAIIHNLYSSSASYEPMKISMAETFYDIKSISTSDGSESSLINGFSYTLKNMRPGEHGAALFYSGMGYSYSGTEQIPAFSPLLFEIELVAAP